MKNNRTPRARPLCRIAGPASPACLTAAALAACLLAGPAHALSINISYDTSVNSAPSGFQSAFQQAASFYETSFSNPITINLSVGWGEVAGQSLGSGTLGASSFYVIGKTYNQVRNAMLNAGAPGYLPASDPTGGRTIDVSTANAKALGFKLAGSPSSLDGSVGFDNTANWTFDPNQRAQTGAYDFIGVAEHEISEVLGRASSLTPGCSGSSCSESVLDLFRYTAKNTLDLSGTSAYFSMDGGSTKVNTFNGKANNGDLGDWSGQTVDAFNYAVGTGEELPVSSGDVQEMATLGYTVAAPVPEPSETAFLLAGLGLLGWRIRRKAG